VAQCDIKYLPKLCCDWLFFACLLYIVQQRDVQTDVWEQSPVCTFREGPDDVYQGTVIYKISGWTVSLKLQLYRINDNIFLKYKTLHPIRLQYW